MDFGLKDWGASF